MLFPVFRRLPLLLVVCSILVLPVRAQTPGEARALLARQSPDALGTHNGVRLWVRGDGSPAVTLRVRIFAASPRPAPPVWISAPIPISGTGWKPITLARSEFTLRAPTAAQASVNPDLPPDAQGAGLPPQTPRWEACDTLVLETTVPRQATIFIDDAAWVTLDETGKVTGETTIDDFEKGNVAAWNLLNARQAVGTVGYGLATQPGQAHSGRVAFKIDVTSPAARRAKEGLAAARKIMAASGKSYIVFTPASLFDPILPGSLPPPAGSPSDVVVQTCPGQTQAATFCIYSPKALTDMSADLTGNLQGIGRIISRSSVAVHVVKVWPQAGTGALRDADEAALVPELLVKDDRVKLAGLTPAVRLSGPARTDIPADTTKQFWLTITVPNGTKPGNYVGRVLVSGRGLAAPIPVRLSVTVLGLRLLSPAKQYAMNLRSRLDPAPAALPSPDGHDLVTDFVGKDTLDRQLDDIVAHGFTIATLADSPQTLTDALGEYKLHGLGTAYNLYSGSGDPQTIEAQRRQGGAPSLTYFVPPDPERLAAVNPGGRLILPTATLITRQADFDALQSTLELPIYNRDGDYAQQLLRTKGQRVSAKRDWWYWPAADENPLQNRLSCGVLLWRANLYGAFVPSYQAAFGADPYDETSAGAALTKAAFRPQMLTYPVQDGLLDTLQWEAAREGVTDVRYLTTMYAALRECKDAHIAKPLVDAAETYVKTFLDKPLAALPEAETDRFRLKVADYAVKMRAAVDAYNQKNGKG